MRALPCLALLCTASMPTLCRFSPRGVRNGVSIINPNYTNITGYSYTVAVLNNNNNLIGGGVLVQSQWVLTAAYNTDGLRPGQLRVRIGSNDPFTGNGLYKVTNIVQHPQYTGDWTYDLALLRLRSPANPSVGKPVYALATQPFIFQTSAVLTGFGATTMNTANRKKAAGQMPGRLNAAMLQIADIQVFNYTYCNQEWYGNELSSGEVCGYAPSVGPCYADFGDPLVSCSGAFQTCTLVGIFAGSYGCADDHFPGIYTDIGAFYSWIQSNIQ